MSVNQTNNNEFTDEIIKNGKTYKLIGIVNPASADAIIGDYNQKHPEAFEKAIQLFKMTKYRNFSIEHADACLYGFSQNFNLSTKIAAAQLRTYILWQHDKVEINFSEEHLNEIEDSTEFLPRKLRRQPFRTYYVKLDLPIVYGFFISKGFYINDEDFYNSLNSLYDSNELFLSIVLYDDNANISHANFLINLSDKGDLKQVLTRAWYNFMQISPLELKARGSIDDIVEVAAFAINTMYYIHDLNKHNESTFKSPTNIQSRVLPNDQSHKDNSQNPKVHTRDFIHNYTTTTFNLSKEQIIDPKVRSPHLRKGHFHTYWVGKINSPDRHRIVKWVKETLVNCCSRDKLSNTKIKI